MKSDGNGPLLSVVTAARNDNYMGDYLWRLSTCINYLAWNLERLGRLDDVEVVIADWDSAVPLHAALPLTEGAARVARFIMVPPEVARSFQFDSTFPHAFVSNAGLRRARGRFIMNIEADTCLTPSSAAALLDILDGRIPVGMPMDEAFCVLSRRQVPVARSRRQPSVPELDRYLGRSRMLLPMDRLDPGAGGKGGGCMMHRSLWEEAQGLDEKCIYWGWHDCDLHLRMSQSRPWIDLANFGVDVIHLEHYSAKEGRRAGLPRQMNRELIPNAPVHEQPDWGMRGRELPEGRSTCRASSDVLSPRAHRAGEIEEWKMTEAELQGELNSAEVMEIPRRVAAAWNMLTAVDGTGTPPHQGLYPAYESEATQWAAWYALYRHPRTYVEFGHRWGFSAAAVALGSPGVEIFGLDAWRPDRNGEPPTIWHYVNTLLTSPGEQSYVQHISGDPEKAVATLFSGPLAPSSVDLVFLRTDPAYGQAVANGLQLAERLSPGGMMIVSGAAASEVEGVTQAVTEKYPGFRAMVSRFGLFSVVLAASLLPGKS